MTADYTTRVVSGAQFLQNLKDSGVLAADDLQTLASCQDDDGPALARRLISLGKLTPYQAVAVLEGRYAQLQIGAYEVLDILGKGAMGTVYKGRHRRMKRLAAIKVLAVEVAGEGAFAQRFQREVETLAQLSHANIVIAFDAGETSAGPYLAMEFVAGRDLATEVKDRGPLSLADALDCTLQAARGLEYAHARGLVHRDIKPANLLRDASGLVKVADLGLAHINSPRTMEKQSALTQAGAIVGTIDYMAPEQALDSASIDQRADIYSLGCTLFYLLTGRPMYSGTSLMSLLLQHRDARLPSLLETRPETPDSLNAIFQRMVAKKPESRYSNMTEVVDALQQASRSVSALGLSTTAVRPAASVGSSASELTVDAASAQQLTDHGPQSSVVTPAVTAPALTNPAPASGPTSPALSGGMRVSRFRAILVAGAVVGLLAVGGFIGWHGWRGGPNARESQTGQGPPAEHAPMPLRFSGVILNGGGSTFVNPLMQHWAAIYEKHQGVRVDYQSVGSERGAQGAINRVYRFGCSDAALTDEQLEQVKRAGGELVHVPLALGAVVPAYNLPGIKRQLSFTGPILADIYLGKIVNWKDPALQIANPGLVLPNLGIAQIHRADASGTTSIWSDYLSKVSGEWKMKFGAATRLNWPGGLEGTGNNGVANLVSRNVGAIGYLELTYALEDNLPFGRIKNREGKFVAPSLESVTAAACALTSIPGDLRLSLTDATGADSYPIVATSYALLYADQTGNPSGGELVAFLRWATHEGQAYVRDVRYAPLPPELVQRIDAALAKIRLALK
jgi:phosphate ABC transporter phosphate-binding protein